MALTRNIDEQISINLARLFALMIAEIFYENQTIYLNHKRRPLHLKHPLKYVVDFMTFWQSVKGCMHILPPQGRRNSSLAEIAAP